MCEDGSCTDCESCCTVRECSDGSQPTVPSTNPSLPTRANIEPFCSDCRYYVINPCLPPSGKVQEVDGVDYPVSKQYFIKADHFIDQGDVIKIYPNGTTAAGVGMETWSAHAICYTVRDATDPEIASNVFAEPTGTTWYSAHSTCDGCVDGVEVYKLSSCKKKINIQTGLEEPKYGPFYVELASGFEWASVVTERVRRANVVRWPATVKGSAERPCMEIGEAETIPRADYDSLFAKGVLVKNFKTTLKSNSWIAMIANLYVLEFLRLTLIAVQVSS